MFYCLNNAHVFRLVAIYGEIINNMDHMPISGNESSSVILSQKKKKEKEKKSILASFESAVGDDPHTGLLWGS